MKIDAHQHFWNYNPKKHDWIDDSMQVIKKDFSPNELEKEMLANGINGCIAVQVEESETETEYLLKLADDNNFIKGVVGWIDLLSPEAEERMLFWKQKFKCKGFRSIVQGKPDHNYLKNEVFIEQVKKLQAHGYSYDLLVYHDQLPSLIGFTEKLPDNRMILDHLGKPDIKNKEIKKWKEHIKILAQHPGIYCKLSGLITEAEHDKWSYNDIQPYLEIAAEYFGADRICFGTDWPVCLLAGTYTQVVETIEKFSLQLSKDEKNKLYAENTMKCYNL